MIAAIILPCSDLTAALAFYCDRLGFRVERISPADDPQFAIVSGNGLRLALDCRFAGPPPTIRLERRAPSNLHPPDGVTIEIAAPPSLRFPKLAPHVVVSRASAQQSGLGRAGMRYRDLIEGRYGGRYVASHIHVADGGPVSDYVHHHLVGFQLIHCLNGWVRLVYEGQGPPFLMSEGDCILQPPTMRHQVLEASAGLEVLEVSSPAEHDTFGDLTLELPDGEVAPTTTWRGQRFVHDVASDGLWTETDSGWAVRETAIGGGCSEAGTVRFARAGIASQPMEIDSGHAGELLLLFVRGGSAEVTCGDVYDLTTGDAIAIPGQTAFSVRANPEVEVVCVELNVQAAS